MSKPARVPNNDPAGIPASIVHKAIGYFSVEIDAADPHLVSLVGSIDRARPLWTRHFGDLADCDAVLECLHTGTLDLTFLGRVTMIFGPVTITAAVDRVVANARKARDMQSLAEAQRRRDHGVINLYAPDSKRRYRLELQRKSEDTASWSVRYDRASERDRLCDWLRWQQPRFAEFLDRAAQHGSEALARLLTDEMFETERRIKKEGRGAGGLRPLRMWRGD